MRKSRANRQRLSSMLVACVFGATPVRAFAQQRSASEPATNHDLPAPEALQTPPPDPEPAAPPPANKKPTDRDSSEAKPDDDATDEEAAPEAAPPTEPARGADPSEPPASPSETEPGEADETDETVAPPQPAQGTRLPSEQAPLPFPNPTEDARTLQGQGNERPGKHPAPETKATGIFAEDWWSHTRPIFEIHGSFRTRGELFYKFALGRIDDPNRAIWARPADDQYTSLSNTTFGPAQCTRDERDSGSDEPEDGLVGCRNNTQSSANLRFRLNPALHISDNLRIQSQIDLLDNLVLGSTPEGYRFEPSDGGGYRVIQRTGYTQYSFQDGTLVPPASGINSLQDSISVKRAWAEYTTPIGELRFGRMPNHWGLGMVWNSGDAYDDDYQSTIDRIMFTTSLRPLELTVAGAWDFPNEGALGTPDIAGGQSYDLAQLDDVDQWALIVLRKKDPELTQQSLSRGDIVFNIGTYVTLRKQLLANEPNDLNPEGPIPNANPNQLPNAFARRALNVWLPDLWFQVLYKKFRFELEAAAAWGSIDSLSNEPRTQADFLAIQDPRRNIRQYGVATELEQLFIEDRLHLNFNFGWASGDPDAFDPTNVGDLVPGTNEIQVNDDTISTFRFNPSYHVDMILHRYLLDRVQGTYYFNPDVGYDFIREGNGQRVGGMVGVVWSRASEFVQTPGHASNLGVELHGTVYFQAKDGSLNDKPGTIGGFYSALQYAVLFPLAGLGYQEQETSAVSNAPGLSAAQLLRFYLGVSF